MTEPKFKIDPEFKSLIPPLTPEERAGLEREILAEGRARDPLVVWNGILLDGHNREEICRKHGLPYTTCEPKEKISDRQAAAHWIYSHQLARRNLTEFQIIEIRLLMKAYTSAMVQTEASAKKTAIANTSEAKVRYAEVGAIGGAIGGAIAGNGRVKQANVAQASKPPPPRPTPSPRSSPPPVRTNAIIGKDAGVSRPTVDKVEYVLKKAPEPVKNAARSGEISINAAYQATKQIEVMPEEKKQAFIERLPAAEEEGIKKQVSILTKKSGQVDYSGDEWYTPADIIEKVRAVFGGTIDLDPASNNHAQKTVKAIKFYTAEDDGLSKEWSGRVFCNPPYSSPLIDKFTEKILGSTLTEAIYLVNNCTDTKWFHSLLEARPLVCLTKGRLAFEDSEGKKFATRQGQAIFYLGPNKSAFIKEFETVGAILEVT